jgi:hypothetical protein
MFVDWWNAPQKIGSTIQSVSGPMVRCGGTRVSTMSAVVPCRRQTLSLTIQGKLRLSLRSAPIMAKMVSWNLVMSRLSLAPISASTALT